MASRTWSACPVLLVSLLAPLHSQAPDSWQDPSLHSLQFVAVAENVRLEVLDWGVLFLLASRSGGSVDMKLP